MSSNLFSVHAMLHWLASVNVVALVLVLVVFATGGILRTRLTANCRSLLLLVVLVRLIIPFSWGTSISVQNLWTSPAHETAAQLDSNHEPVDATHLSQPVVLNHAITNEPQAPSINSKATQGATAVSNPLSDFPLLQVAVSIWLGVASILWIRLAVKYIALKTWSSSLEELRNAQILQMVRECTEEVGLSRPIRVLSTQNESSPAVTGVIHPTLLLPADCVQKMSQEELKYVLLHELRHIKSYDLLISFLWRMVCALHWFNPAVWFAFHTWLSDREIACDSWVLTHVGHQRRREYGEILLKIAQSSRLPQPLVLTAGLVAFPSLLERRLNAMRTLKPATIWSRLVGAAVVIAIAGIGLTDAVNAEPVQPEASVTEVAVNVIEKNLAEKAAAETDDQQPSEKQEKRAEIHPKVVITGSRFLWEAKEVMTEQEFVARVKKLQAIRKVVPHYHMTNGFGLRAHKDQEEMQRVINLADGWKSLTFIGNRGSTLLDKIESAADLSQPTEPRRIGFVYLEDGSPAKDAQVVIVPTQHVSSVFLRGTQLAEELDEQTSRTNESGIFIVHPSVDDYGIYILHQQGFGFFPGPIAESASSYQLQPWATLTIDTTQWEEDLWGEIWSRPFGSESMKSGLSIMSVKKTEKPMVFKVPPGKVRISENMKFDDGTGVFVENVERLTLQPGESRQVTLKPLSEEQRKKGLERRKSLNWSSSD